MLMKRTCTTLFLILFSFYIYANGTGKVTGADTNEVNTLNKNAYKSRLTNPNETIKYANIALTLSLKIGYNNGTAEAFRVRGIGKSYLNKPDSAISDYFEALKYYELSLNQVGQANVFNNIGNLYQEVDYDKALTYFNKAEVIAQATHNNELLAKLDLNFGNVYNHKNSLTLALKYYISCYDLITKLNNKVLIVQCLQNLGVVYFKLTEYDKSEKILLQANQEAKAQDLNSSVASINLQLSDIYLSEKRYDEDEKFLNEGQTFAKLANNERDIYDYTKSWYQLESQRQNYKKALNYLTELFKKDSVTYNTNLSTNFNLASQEKEHEEKVNIAKKDSDIATQRFWLLAVVAGLLLIVIVLLMTNVKRKALTNNKLTELNNEVSRQKDNLDRINHHLEEIIDERTRDLQAKNKKLSEYSSYLSHQIRGPIATLKGLMNLEREVLVDQAECINMMDKCVSEIDEKIIEMSDMLHDPGKSFQSGS